MNDMPPRTKPKTAPLSAGILLYRYRRNVLNVLLVHPGGPFWRNRWRGWWQIPKGLVGEKEAPLAAAHREFSEETGYVLEGPSLELGEVRQRGGKRVVAYAVEGDLDVAKVESGTFEMEWPPRSGRRACFPEIDQARWMSPDEAAIEMLPSQLPFLERLRAVVPARA